jgi:hypothetical protein
MKLLVFLFIPFFAFAIDPQDQMLLSPGAKSTMKSEQNTIQQGVSQEIQSGMMQDMQKKAAAGIPTSLGTSDVMIVDPKVVSQDWVDAFNALSQKKVNKIVFLIKDSMPLADVVDISSMPGGYLMLFTLKTVRGPKYKIVKTSDIASLMSE